MQLKTETKLQAGIWKEGHKGTQNLLDNPTVQTPYFLIWHGKRALQCLLVPACLLFILNLYYLST